MGYTEPVYEEPEGLDEDDQLTERIGWLSKEGDNIQIIDKEKPVSKEKEDTTGWTFV